MKPQHLKSLLSALLMAGAVGAISAYASGIHDMDGGEVPLAQARATVVAGPDLDLADNLPADLRIKSNRALDAGGAEPRPVETAAESVDERSDAFDSEATAPVDQDWAPLEHLGLTQHRLHTSGAETVGGAVKVDTDVQYPLNNKWVMGSELESHHADPLAVKADVDQYAFGLHINL
jgi:hypothetical protein